jgi:peptidyl-prolyl cis-trans isomerase A (cyclophilin A)
MKRSTQASLSALTAIVVLIAACDKAPPPNEALLHPDPAKLAAAAPDSFSVHVVTSRGPFDLKIRRDWSPIGVDRLYYLVSNGFYDGVRFYRVMDGFMAQFGAPGDTAVARAWSDRTIKDDFVKHGNTRGTLTFAKTSAPDSRGTQLFINYRDNTQLDGMSFSPLGEVTAGMPVVDSLFSGYGEGPPGGHGPDQAQLAQEGNAYLLRQYSRLDYIVTARVSQEWKKSN